MQRSIIRVYVILLKKETQKVFEMLHFLATMMRLIALEYVTAFSSQHNQELCDTQIVSPLVLLR